LVLQTRTLPFLHEKEDGSQCSTWLNFMSIHALLNVHIVVALHVIKKMENYNHYIKYKIIVLISDNHLHFSTQ
jgi:hypothetical protein